MKHPSPLTPTHLSKIRPNSYGSSKIDLYFCDYAPVIRYSPEQSLQIVPSWSKCVILMVAMATKQNFKHCCTWSQLKAQQSLPLDSTIGMTSWNYIFSERDGFEVEKNKSPKFCVSKCKSILRKFQSIVFWYFPYVVAHKLRFKIIPVAKSLTV